MNSEFILKKGIVLVDKPAGITSFELVEKIKPILEVKKAGHSGTLDLAVTGVMLIALDEATKAMPILVGLDKEYEGVMQIHAEVKNQLIEEVCESFLGKIIQTPPRRSAVKRQPREREIYAFEILGIDNNKVHFMIKCQSGTYIRKICSDIGEKLGCGAHMLKLIRTKVGPFTLKSCVEHEKLSQRNIISLEKVIEKIGIKKVFIKDEFLEKVMNGMAIDEKWVEKYDKGINKGEIIAIYLDNSVIGLGKFKEKKFAKTDRLFKFQSNN